ncbi:hypothetical protein MSM1_19600 [Mycobacterium sp. SM1]|uniref:glutamate-cysteine ligase family protein n=1 Tax=Mycobacterium sp. SM1 TaxID=2816243 RepID=UPI001BCD959B|nr:hypothetical protein [Mycobacterium sp. SM1]
MPRTNPVPLSSNPELDWARYALGADVFYINNGGASLAVAPGLSFGTWITHGHSIGWPTEADFCYHLTTLFPPIRPRGWLELRMIDALPHDLRAAAVHLVHTATCDPVAADLLATLPETRHLWRTSARDGLTHPTLRSGAQTLIATALKYLRQTPGQSTGADCVEAFADRYTYRGQAPGDTQSCCETDAFDSGPSSPKRCSSPLSATPARRSATATATASR